MSRQRRLIAAALLLLGLCWTTPTPTSAARLTDPGDIAVVATTEGDLLSLRDGPGASYAVLRGLAAGTEVLVLDGPIYNAGIAWYQVTVAELIGWCAGEWLLPPAQEAGTRYISGTEGSGVWLRDEPGFAGERMLLIPEGGALVLLGTASHADGIDWVLVRYSGAVGWVAAGFTNGTSAGLGGAIPPVLPATSAGLAVGSHALVTGSEGQEVRIRRWPGLEAPLYSAVPEGAIVLIVNGPRADENGFLWYGVDYDEIQGWVFGGYLAPTIAALTQRAGPARSNPIRGEALVTEAFQHIGTPYVWGGDGPNGWDCSGMIQWLYATVAGVALPRVSQQQFLVGAPLNFDEIEPGDIVFFFDTDGPGITHNGIAIGNGQFIHARNQSFGTVISSLYEPFWGDHFAGARRP